MVARFFKRGAELPHFLRPAWWNWRQRLIGYEFKTWVGGLIFFVLSICPNVASANEPVAGTPEHISSEACASCHVNETKVWRQSHHAWAWKTPTPESVLGDFDNTRFVHKGMVSKFTTHEGKYYVETEGSNGKPAVFEIKGAIGITPLQQYVVETAPGRLQAFDVAWDTINRRWYHLYPEQKMAANDGLHWTGPYKNWNSRCAECHATDYEKKYDVRGKTYASTSAEIAVGCEACHGPGEAHAKWANSPPAFDRSIWMGVNAHGLTTKFPKNNPLAEIEKCAQCHSRREPLGEASPPAHEPFDDHYRLALLRNGLYHPDGQILGEVYVYGSFLQSKMQQQGVRCTDCHDPHSGKLRADGNATCTQCHNPVGDARFPTLPKRQFDGIEHHFHKPGTPGAACVNCHMPERYYMITDGRRDHSFRIPRPYLSVALGTPNACTHCHADKPASWAAHQLEQWYPDALKRQPHYGQAIAAGRGSVDRQTAAALMALADDKTAPTIARATALDLLRAHDRADIAKKMAPHLEDPTAIVRAAAVSLQRSAPAPARTQRLVGLLEDPVSSVRISVARVMLGLRGVRFPPKVARNIQSVMAEYRQSLSAKADFPEIQMVIGGTAMVLRNPRAAERAFGEAVRMDPQLVQAWQTRARILAASQNAAAAEQILKEAIGYNPSEGELYYSLGQLQMHLKKNQAAIQTLESAIRLLPGDSRPKAALGMFLSRRGMHEEALGLLNAISDANATMPDVLLQMIVSNLALGRTKAAALKKLKLELMHPQSPMTKQADKLIPQ